MKKKLVTIILAGALTVASAFTALASWEQTGTTWKYQTNGTYYNDGWHWIDGNGDNIAECYFFNTDSTMLSNTTTPDNFTVNENGAWTVNGVVQTKVLNGSTSSSGNKEGTEAPTQAPTQPQTEVPTQAPVMPTAPPETEAPQTEAPTKAPTQVPETEVSTQPQIQETQGTSSKYYKDDGTLDAIEVAKGVMAGDPEASELASEMDTGGASGNANWN